MLVQYIDYTFNGQLRRLSFLGHNLAGGDKEKEKLSFKIFFHLSLEAQHVFRLFLSPQVNFGCYKCRQMFTTIAFKVCLPRMVFLGKPTLI